MPEVVCTGVVAALVLLVLPVLGFAADAEEEGEVSVLTVEEGTDVSPMLPVSSGGGVGIAGGAVVACVVVSRKCSRQ